MFRRWLNYLIILLIVFFLSGQVLAQEDDDVVVVGSAPAAGGGGNITFTDGAGAVKAAWLSAATLSTLSVTVPAGYSTIVVVALVEATTTFDALSFRGNYLDFSNIVTYQSDGASAIAFYMHNTHANAPSAGSQTLSFSFDGELQSNGGYIHCYFLGNTDTSITAFDTDTGNTTNWVSDDLTVAATGMSFVAAATYGESMAVATANTIFDTAFGGYEIAGGYELGKATPGITGVASYMVAISFAFVASP